MDSRDDPDGRARRLYEVGGGDFQLQAALARAHVNVVELQGGFVDKDGEVFFEPQRAATAADVARERGQVLEGDGLDFFVARDLGGALQIDFQIPGDHAN